MSDFNLIGQIKIDAGNSNDVIKNLNGNIQVLATKLNDVEVKSGGANNSLKNFFKEQRLQDRTMREGIQSITSLALVFNTLGGNSSEASKKLGESLSMAAGVMNSMEFAGFGLSQMGKGLGGTLGMLAGRIGGMLGPIGMVVGVGVGLLEFFDDSKEKAEAARVAQEKLNKEVDDYARKLNAFTSGEQVKAMESVIKLEINAGKERLRILEGVSISIKSGASSINLQGKEIQAFTQFGLDVNKFTEKQLDDAILKQKEILSLKNNELKKTQEISNLYTVFPKIKPSKISETDKDEDKDEQQKVDAHANALRTIDQMNIQFAKDEKTRLELEKNEKLAEAEAILKDAPEKTEEVNAIKLLIEEDFGKKITALGEQEIEKKKDLEKGWLDFKDSLVTDEIEQIKNAEKEKLDIVEQAIQDGLISRLDAQKVIAKITEQATADEVKVEVDKDKEIANAHKELHNTQVKLMNDSFNAAISFAKQGSDLQKGLALTQIMTNLAIGLSKSPIIAGEGAIATGPLAPIMYEVYYLQNVMSVLGAIMQAKNVLGFAKGGFTGEGGRYEEAGMVHKGEVVFEKPLVDKYKNPLLQLRSMMQNGGSYVPYNTNGYDMGTQRELKALRSDMNVFMKQDRNVNVSLRGTLKGQKFLKDEMPKHNKFTKNKYV